MALSSGYCKAPCIAMLIHHVYGGEISMVFSLTKVCLELKEGADAGDTPQGCSSMSRGLPILKIENIPLIKAPRDKDIIIQINSHYSSPYLIHF